MPKNRRNLKFLTITAMMTALSVIIERFIVPTFQGQPFRVDFGNIPILICAFVCGPVYGALCGVLGDIIGCFFNSYAPFLPLTVSPLLIGLIPGFFSKKSNVKTIFFMSVFMTYIIAEILWTPFGLAIMKGTPYLAEFVINLPAAAFQTVVDPLIVFLIFKSHILEKMGVLSK